MAFYLLLIMIFMEGTFGRLLSNLTETSMIFKPGSEYTKEVTIKQANIGQRYSHELDSKSEYHFVYTYSVKKTETLKLTTEVTTYSPNPDFPMRVTVRYDKASVSWQVPLRLNKIVVSKVERTLCLLDNDENSVMTIVVSTSALKAIEFSLKLDVQPDFISEANMGKTLYNVMVGSPAFQYVKQSGNDSLIRIQVESQENVCGLVSVQKLQCPVVYEEDSIRSMGSWQTMLKLATFTIQSADYDQGFFLVFVTLKDDVVCGNDTFPTGVRLKSFKYSIDIIRSSTAINFSIAATIVFSLLAGVSSCLAAYFYFRPRVGTVSPAEEPTCQTDFAVPRKPRSEHKGPKFVSELCQKENIWDDEERNSLSKSSVKTMFQQSDLYIWLVSMMVIFYGIPALQLVIKYQERLTTTGNNDLCYYNFKCSFPVFNVLDFNHILSNLSYMVFGLTFMVIIWYKKKHYDVRPKSKTSGVPQHFGIYYAMGIALMAEGFLSACYHVCPTNENFQFDTTFMYVIAVLCFMKIYQFRHPDITSNAYKIFFGIAMVVFLEVVGIFFNNLFFWTFSLVLYFIAILLLSSIIYSAGKWSFNHIAIWSLIKLFVATLKGCSCSKETCSFENIPRKRLAFILIMDFCNIALMIVGALHKPNISTYLLMIFVGNLFIYFFYYLSLKLINKEKILVQFWIVVVLATLFWIPGLVFFQLPGKKTSLTPAQSRNINLECYRGGFYDNHDIWHFLSSAGLFLCFTTLLIMDDGIADVPRDQILIF